MKVLNCNLAIMTFKCHVKAVPIGEDFIRVCLFIKKKKSSSLISHNLCRLPSGIVGTSVRYVGV